MELLTTITTMIAHVGIDILEIAAMNHRQKKMGYNTAEEFSKKLMQQMGIEEP